LWPLSGTLWQQGNKSSALLAGPAQLLRRSSPVIIQRSFSKYNNHFKMNAKDSFFPEVGEVKLRFKSILSPEREKPFNMLSSCFELCRNSVPDFGWTQKLSSDSDLDPVLDFLMMSAAIAIRRVRKCPISRLCFPREDLGTNCHTLNEREKERVERAGRRRLREKNLKVDCTLLRVLCAG
jgi:hypothetical protein